MSTSPTCIVAYTGEGDHFKAVREAAVKMAKTSSASLIFYDVDAASPFAKPLPTNWSAGDAEDEVPNRLQIDDLERAGRQETAAQVRAARDAGIDAYGWLPGDKGGESLAEYAREQKADLIMVPSQLDDPGIIDRLRSATLDDVEEHTNRPIAIVGPDGEVEMT